jgi:hypothetical protein
MESDWKIHEVQYLNLVKMCVEKEVQTLLLFVVNELLKPLKKKVM